MAPWLLVLFLASFQDPAPATIVPLPGPDQDSWTVELGAVRRVFARTPRRGWTTVRLESTDRMVPVSSTEFTVHLADGRSLTPDTAGEVTVQALTGADRQGVTVTHGFEDVRVVVEYFTTASLPTAHKQVRVEALVEGAVRPAVESWEVEAFFVEGATGGGVGMPAEAPGLWVGLANPLAEANVQDGTIRLHHGPRRQTDRSAVAILGVATQDQSALAALRAVWSADLPRQRAVFHESLAGPADAGWLGQRLRRLRRHLSRANGGRLDALVLDQGWWSDPASLTPDPGWLPDEGGPLSHSLRDSGAGLGLGIPVQGDLSTDAERARLLRAVMGRLGRMSPSYVEHSLSTGSWSDPERAADNLLTLLQAERRFRPGAFLSISGPVASPWWLLSVDAVRSDSITGPTPTNDPLWAWRTGEDALLWQRASQGIPLERITTNTPVVAKATDREWVEQFFWAAARGSRELSLPPGPERWSAPFGADLSQVLRWCDDRQALLDVPVQTVGGPPLSGRTYGYLHQDGERAILILRNPTLDPVRWSLPETASPWLVTYPWCERVGGASVSLPGGSLLCLETLATVEDLADVPDRGRFRPGERGPRASRIELLLAPGESRRFHWWNAAEDTPASLVGLAPSAGRRPVPVAEAPPQLTSSLAADRIQASIEGMGAWFGEQWQVLVRYDGDPQDVAEEDLVAETSARTFRILTDGGLWILTPRTVRGPWSIDLPLGSSSGVWEIRVRLTGHLETAEIKRAHPLRSLGAPVLPPDRWAREQVHEFLLGRIAPLSATPPPLNVPR